MKHAPAFQLFTDDWLGSTKIALLTPAEEGAYIRLLCHCWNDHGCTLPDDDALLAVLSRLGEGWFNGSGAKLRSCFTPYRRHPGRLCNIRLLAEFKSLQKFRRDKQRAGQIGGMKSGISRRQMREKVSEIDTKHTFVSASSKTKAKQSSSSSSSSSLKNKTICAAFDTFWEAYPKKKSKGQAEKVWATLQPDDSLFSRMLRKVEEASQTHDWKKDNGKFIPYPATWLSAKGWEDEIAAPRKERLPL